MGEPNDAADWLKVDQVAAQVGVSRETVRRAIRDGELPAFRVRRQYRIRVSDVACLLVPVAKGGFAPA